MVYELTPIDLNHYRYHKPLMRLINAIRRVHGIHLDITVTITITGFMSGPYTVAYTDKGRSTNAE